MPVTKQAIKKVRQDKRKTEINARRKLTYKKAVRNFLKSPGEAGLKAAYKALDLAAKTNVVHKNKASRLKSRLSKKQPKTTSTAPKNAAKSVTKKRSK